MFKSARQSTYGRRTAHGRTRNRCLRIENSAMSQPPFTGTEVLVSGGCTDKTVYQTDKTTSVSTTMISVRNGRGRTRAAWRHRFAGTIGAAQCPLLSLRSNVYCRPCIVRTRPGMLFCVPPSPPPRCSRVNASRRHGGAPVDNLWRLRVNDPGRRSAILSIYSLLLTISFRFILSF